MNDIFVDYLTNTLIPDLHDSGSHATAEDFEKCVKMINSYANNLVRALEKNEFLRKQLESLGEELHKIRTTHTPY